MRLYHERRLKGYNCLVLGIFLDLNIHRTQVLLIHTFQSDRIILFMESILFFIKNTKFGDMGGVVFELGLYCLKMSF